MKIAAGHLHLRLAGDGQIVSLVNAKDGSDCRHPERTSALLSIVRFGDPARLFPERVDELPGGDATRTFRFRYAHGIVIDVTVAEKTRYARLTLAAVRDPAGQNPVQAAFWGPVVTNLTGAPGELIGLLRGDGFSVGMLSLEPNTDGSSTGCVGPYGWEMARWLDDGSGSLLEGECRDHTRDGVGLNAIAIRGEPGLTVVGSAVAIFSCATEDELDVIEAIERGEGLPHPVRDGEWLKRSAFTLRPSVWCTFDESNVDERIDMARRMGAMTLCSFRDMFGNWGHFEPDPKLWPSGMAGIRAAAGRARAAGVELVMYTLTTFLKPHPHPEPYLAPVPDDRLQTMGPASQLARDARQGDDVFVLEKREGLPEALKIDVRLGPWLERHWENQFVRVGNEIVYYRSVREEAGHLVLEGCRRATFHTRPAAHGRGTKVVRLCLREFRNFYPGTLGMQDEVADRIAQVALDGDFGQITFDGHESCCETGHGIYSRNRLTQRVYERCGGRIPLYTGSNLGNYDWHVLSFMRWGEFDMEKGFRGSMLDYRLMRQVQLQRNRMPHGLGQYYPSEATQEDVEWLMARAAGWNAAVDMTVYFDTFARNPEREAILATIRLWNQAQREAAFSGAQRLELRQADRLYTLCRDKDGSWQLAFRNRWRHPDVRWLEPSVFAIEPTGPSASVVPCSIDWNWAHNPGIFVSAGLSDDLVGTAGESESAWRVTWPAADREADDYLQFVLRPAVGAVAPLRDPHVTLDGRFAFSIRATIEPGQYLSLAHDMPLAFLYNDAHEVVAEAPLVGRHGPLPRVPRGRPCRIGLRFTSAGPGCILNLRTQETIKPAPEGGVTDRVLAETNRCIQKGA